MNWQFLNYEISTQAGDVVEVTLKGNAANVLLLDDGNFASYQAGKPFRYHKGGYYTHSPVVLATPRPGKWHVVVDLGGRPGHVNAAVRVMHPYG
jgi:Domain of unknown function (DUF1883)